MNVDEVLLTLALVSGALCAQTDLGRIVPADGPLHIAVVGDYGSGNAHQKAVANAMIRRNLQTPFDFGLTLGDNFYRCGVRNTNDRKWQTRWEEMYAAMHIHFYATLGNHDYGHPPAMCPAFHSSPDAEVARTQESDSWRMPARYYTFTAGPARFIAIDTEGWSGAQLEWIRQTLARSAGEPGIRWRIVYGHHPLYTSGYHINQRRIAVLRRDLLPVLREGKVDLVISGHDHDMEHLVSGNMDFLICGTGGAELRQPSRAQPQSVFHIARYGFLDLNVDRSHLAAQFLSDDLEPLEPHPLQRTH